MLQSAVHNFGPDFQCVKLRESNLGESSGGTRTQHNLYYMLTLYQYGLTRLIWIFLFDKLFCY